uniref:Uncharacterized protein n=1 Tax=Oryza sativa subsp. japonica TaxID=39947 RepID=Q8LII6_ORYSJ|nr:hypothetical protein [Oryza sativa Japonica Group]
MGEFRPVLLPLRLPSIVPRSNPVLIHADLEIAGAAALPLLQLAGRTQPLLDGGQNQDSSGGYCSWQSVARSACPSMKPHSTPSCVTRGKPYRALNGEVSIPLLLSQHEQSGRNGITGCSTRSTEARQKCKGNGGRGSAVAAHQYCHTGHAFRAGTIADY